MMLRKNKRIGDYTVMSRIGSGRYGVCFLARSSDGRQVVLKRFRRRMRRKNRFHERHEAVILSGLRHPALPQLEGVINDRHGYFFVLEYKAGKSLARWLFDEKKSFSEAEIRDIGTQLFRILEYLESRSVIHGDISISNILYDGEVIALIDFGLARYEGTRGMSFSLDLARTADVLLYLLYSCYGETACGSAGSREERTWRQELPLSREQQEFIGQLLEPDTFGREASDTDATETVATGTDPARRSDGPRPAAAAREIFQRLWPRM